MRLSFLWTHRRLEQNATLPAWASVQVRDIPSDDDAHKPITPPLRQSTTSKSPLRKDRFPEIASATAAVIPKDTVLDGEVVVWNGARLDFELLQQRLAGGAARIARQVREHPASYVVFDVLAINGEDLRNRPLRERRATLENMAKQWAPPLQLSPLTDDITTAQAWLTDYRQAGIEGLVIKGAGTRYEPNQHRWIKVKARESIEVIMGAVIGPIDRPESIVAGLYRNGTLVIAGSSVPLTTAQSRSLAKVLTLATTDHPWPDTVASNRFGGGRDRDRLTKVELTVVAEVTADTALQSGFWRHPVRFIRFRPELHPDDVPQLTPGTAGSRLGCEGCCCLLSPAGLHHGLEIPVPDSVLPGGSGADFLGCRGGRSANMKARLCSFRSAWSRVGSGLDSCNALARL